MKWNEFRKAQCGSDALAADAPAGGAAVFPKAVDAKYASKTPSKARFKTCVDHQYRANKTNGGNGGMKWVMKGGYYSECNKRLKG